MSGGEIAILKAKLADCRQHVDLLHADKMMEVRGRIDAQNQFFTATARIRDLEGAIRRCLEENAHLADGDNCTLIDLKQAINWNAEEKDRA